MLNFAAAASHTAPAWSIFSLILSAVCYIPAMKMACSPACRGWPVPAAAAACTLGAPWYTSLLAVFSDTWSQPWSICDAPACRGWPAPAAAAACAPGGGCCRGAPPATPAAAPPPSSAGQLPRPPPDCRRRCRRRCPARRRGRQMARPAAAGRVRRPRPHRTSAAAPHCCCLGLTQRTPSGFIRNLHRMPSTQVRTDVVDTFSTIAPAAKNEVSEPVSSKSDMVSSDPWKPAPLAMLPERSAMGGVSPAMEGAGDLHGSDPAARVASSDRLFLAPLFCTPARLSG